jgi:hypothetical protein
LAKTTDTKHELEKVNKEHELVKEDVYDIQNNKIFGQDVSFLIGNKIMQRTDPIYYCENVLRCHLPEKKRHLHENQVELIRAVCNPHYRKVAALMARQAGKCFEADTLIMMADGTSKKVQDIKVGDYVMSPQSTPSEVIALGSGYEEMYEICTAEKYYKNFTVNGSHILAVKDKMNKIKTITVNDYLKLTKNRQDELVGYRVAVNFDEKPITINPYQLGNLLGNNENKYLSICINECLYNSMNIRKEFLAGLIEVKEIKKESTSLEISFSDEQVANAILKIFQFCGFKSFSYYDEELNTFIVNAYGDFTDIPIGLKEKQFTNVPNDNYLDFEFTVESKGVGKYYGFVIKSDDHLFLLDDCTVVHNTESISSLKVSDII